MKIKEDFAVPLDHGPRLAAGGPGYRRAGLHRGEDGLQGYEIDQRSIKRDRYGSFWLDLFNYRRKVDIAGWRFNGVLLMRDGVVVYKLTGGQPAIHEYEESTQPLGPFQSIGESGLFR